MGTARGSFHCADHRCVSVRVVCCLKGGLWWVFIKEKRKTNYKMQIDRSGGGGGSGGGGAPN